MTIYEHTGEARAVMASGGVNAKTVNHSGSATLDASTSGNVFEHQDVLLVADTAVEVWPVTTVTGPVYGFGMANLDLRMALQTYFKVEAGSTLVIDHLSRTLHLDGELVFGFTGKFFPVRSSQELTVTAGLTGPGFSATMVIPNAEGTPTRSMTGGASMTMTGNSLVNPRARIGATTMTLAALSDNAWELTKSGSVAMTGGAAGTWGWVYERTGGGVVTYNGSGGDAQTQAQTGTGVSPRVGSGASNFTDNPS